MILSLATTGNLKFSLREEELEQILALKDQVLLMERQMSDSQGWPLGCMGPCVYGVGGDLQC